MYAGRNRLNTAGITAIPQNSFDFLLFPNPAVEKIITKYTLQKTGDVDFTITDLKGKVITSVNKQSQSIGDHVLVLNLPDQLAAGNYFVKMTCGNQSISKPVSLVH